MTTETGAPTLTEFLLARIADDEARATHWFETWRRDGGLIDLTLTPGPARVQAECEAKRRIVARIRDIAWTGSYAVRDFVLGEMAAVYADHPDYRDEWR